MIHRIHRGVDSARPWRRLRAGERGSERVRIRAGDGQELVLHRVRGGDDTSGPGPNGPPLMLLHGLGSNHVGFRFPERSFADWLAARGHDVWLPELRGHGESKRARYDWHFDDYLRWDLPAILDTIRERTGQERVNWVGHSMGGVLLYCYAALNPDAPIARGVSIGSALDYRIGSTDFRRMLMLRPVLERVVAVPWGTLVHLLAPALGRGFDGVERFNVWPANVDAKVIRRIHAQCFHSIPVSLLTSLATSFELGGLRTRDGFQFVPAATNIDIPVMLLAGTKDHQVSVAAVEYTAMLIGNNAELRVHGREHGDAEHYGHWDLIVGDRAEHEVWPGIAEFLER